VSALPPPRIDRGPVFARELGQETAIEMSASARLAAALTALGLGAIALAGALADSSPRVLRAGLLVLLPLAVGALGTLLVRPPARPRPAAAEVPIPAVRHLPLLLALLLADLLPVALGWLTGHVTIAVRAPVVTPFGLLALIAGAAVLPFVATVGWEWGLRARLYAPWAEAGRTRLAFAASVVCGTLLSLPAIAPGFRSPERDFVVAALVSAALREAIAVRLYRRAGVLLSGAFRGLATFGEAFLLADWHSPWLPVASWVAGDAGFYALRPAGPALAALAAWGWLARLDRRDAEERLRL
jgi:hypothetical protein